MKILLVLLLTGVSIATSARPLGDCVNPRNHSQVDEMKIALSNGILSSVETSKLYTAENCGEYNKKLSELLELSHQRQRESVSNQ